MTLTGEILVENMTPQERARAEIVESVLPELRKHAEQVDRDGEFYLPNVETLANAGLLGLMVSEKFGGLGGGLRDLVAATFAMGSACPSTALTFFFQCSATSRGSLLLDAIEEGLFDDDLEQREKVRQWSELMLGLLGREKKWMGNFTSESTKQEKSAVTLSTRASKTEGGYLLNGVKSFACGYGVADYYLVTAVLDGYEGEQALCNFIVDRNTHGLDRRIKWDALGMRGSATDGLVMNDVFVPEQYALAVPGAFAKSIQMSRGSFVGNQMAGSAVYAGVAWSVYDYTVKTLQEKTFKDTGKPIGTGPFYQQLLGEMMTELETALLWLRRQLELETVTPPIMPKQEVVKRWRLCKGQVSDSAFNVGLCAFKAAGTSGTLSDQLPSRALRELAMGVVQAYPSERGKLMAAALEIVGQEQKQFSTSL